MNSQKQDPIKKLNKTKATSQLKSFFETNGYDLENPVVKGKIESAISDPDNFERNVRSIYSRYYEGSQPLNFDSIFESMYDIQEAPMQPFVNEVESEKKRLPKRKTLRVQPPLRHSKRLHWDCLMT